jgi:hypothetical protein
MLHAIEAKKAYHKKKNSSSHDTFCRSLDMPSSKGKKNDTLSGYLQVPSNP